MSFLKSAENKMGYAKIGLYGPAGSGKTFTAAKIAIGLIEEYQLKKSVAMFDTEPAASFIAPYFKEKGIDFFVYDESRALPDLLKMMDEAEGKCSVFILDSVTHIWKNLQKSYLDKFNETRAKYKKKPIAKLEFHHWNPIKDAFGEFTDKFLSSNMHFIVCGRMGGVYEYQKNEETGKMELITTGNKMASEKEMGYEPSLLVELTKERNNGRIENIAMVEKDRADRINGQSFLYPKFEHFKPHFKALNIGGAHFGSMNQRNAGDLFTGEGDDNWSYEKKQREIYCEEIQALILTKFPGQTKDDKLGKAEIIQNYFQTGSWTKVTNMNSEKLKEIFNLMKMDFSMEKNEENN